MLPARALPMNNPVHHPNFLTFYLLIPAKTATFATLITADLVILQSALLAGHVTVFVCTPSTTGFGASIISRVFYRLLVTTLIVVRHD